MADLSPEIAADIVAACQAGAEEAAGALSRTFDLELTMAVGEAATYDPAAAPAGLDGPGLAVLMKFGDAGAIAVLPAASGLVPDWVREPDATGESKLSTLGQELSMLLVPETLMADDFQAAWVDDLSAALGRAELAEAAGLVPLTLTAGEESGELTLIWPAAALDALFPAKASAEEAAEPAIDEQTTAEQPAAPIASVAASGASAAASAQANPARPQITDLSQLPPYSRSLLKVEVPLTVCLASKKQTIEEIVDLGPGAIITFEKSCDEPVHLTIVDEAIALGEVVKVGEKFGVRIEEMVLPDESFKAVRRRVS